MDNVWHCHQFNQWQCHTFVWYVNWSTWKCMTLPSTEWGNAIGCLPPTQCRHVGQKSIHNCTIVRHCPPPSVGKVIQLCHQPQCLPTRVCACVVAIILCWACMQCWPQAFVKLACWHTTIVLQHQLAANGNGGSENHHSAHSYWKSLCCLSIN